MEHLNEIVKTIGAIEKRHKDILSFAKLAYKPNKRSSGYPYIVHIEGILVKMIDLFYLRDLDNEIYKKYDIKIDLLIDLAILHDVVEDTKYTFADIENLYYEKIDLNFISYLNKYDVKNKLIPNLKLLTRIEGEDYKDYIEKVKESKTASYIKMLDLSDNLNLSSLGASIDDKSYKRAIKYLDSFKTIDNRWHLLNEAKIIRDCIRKSLDK